VCHAAHTFPLPPRVGVDFLFSPRGGGLYPLVGTCDAHLQVPALGLLMLLAIGSFGHDVAVIGCLSGCLPILFCVIGRHIICHT
jgi:hypothetical protein